MEVVNFIGWAGGILLAICSFPQAFKSFIEGHSKYVPNMLLVLWGAGEVCALIYVFYYNTYPLLFNYTLNIVSFSIILYFKLKPRERGYYD